MEVEAVMDINALREELETCGWYRPDGGCKRGEIAIEQIEQLQAENERLRLAVSGLLFSYNRHWIRMPSDGRLGTSPTEIAQSVVNAEQALKRKPQ